MIGYNHPLLPFSEQYSTHMNNISTHTMYAHNKVSVSAHSLSNSVWHKIGRFCQLHLQGRETWCLHYTYHVCTMVPHCTIAHTRGQGNGDKMSRPKVFVQRAHKNGLLELECVTL